MKKFYLIKIVLLMLFIGKNSSVLSQGIPELLYYKFNDSGSTSIKNLALYPPKGTTSATINGNIKQTPPGACKGGLLGSGIISSTDYVETYWKDSLVGTSWTISFWTKNLDSSSTLYYMFNDATAGNFRCFSGGVAQPGNLLLRGPFNDVLLSGGATKLPSVATFVYDAKAGYIYAYKNGSLINSVAQSSISLISTSSLILSGLVGSTTYGGLNAGGVMDEFRFYDRALSASEVALLVYNPTTFSTTRICGTSSYKSPSGKYTWSTPGIYYDTILAQGYCDSFKSIGKFIYTGFSHTSSTLNEKACNFYLSPSGNQYWVKSGTYRETIPNAKGCDSVITVNLTVNYSTDAKITIKQCKAYTSPSGKYTWSTPGIYLDTIPNSKGCDSLLTILLSIGKPNASSMNVKTCDRFKSPSGRKIYTSSGIYKDTLINKTGCDSIITINLTLGKSSFATISPTVCNTYKSPSGKINWKSSGQYMDTIRNASGCDSVITVNLTVKKTTYSQLYPTACGKYVSPSGKYTFSVTNSFYDTIPNAAGCDSVMLIELKILQHSQRTITQTICKQMLSPSKRYIWKISGKYFDTIPNRKGCDSIITFNLTVNSLDVSVLQNNARLTANASGVNYQWLNCNTNYSRISGATSQIFTATALGRYAVEINSGTCTDTSICYTVSDLSIHKFALNSYLSLQPNPNKGIFQIKSIKPFESATIKVLNAVGEPIIQMDNVKGDVLDLDISTQSNGIYFLEVYDRSQMGTLKIIKQ